MQELACEKKSGGIRRRPKSVRIIGILVAFHNSWRYAHADRVDWHFPSFPSFFLAWEKRRIYGQASDRGDPWHRGSISVRNDPVGGEPVLRILWPAGGHSAGNVSFHAISAGTGQVARPGIVGQRDRTDPGQAARRYADSAAGIDAGNGGAFSR